MFITRHSRVPHSGLVARREICVIRVDGSHLLIIFSLAVLGIEPGDISGQYDLSDWKEYFCVLEREPPAIRIFLDEQVGLVLSESS